jgi:hypothetical protein
VEANSFIIHTHTFGSDTVPDSSHFQQKHQIRNTERPLPLVLVVTHRRIETVDAIAIVHLTIYNNNGNNALSMKRYSARLTRLKPKIKRHQGVCKAFFSGLVDSFAKSINYHKETILSTLPHFYYN